MIEVSAFGAIAGLLLAIFLIIKRFQPAYSLMLGALIGGLLGGASLQETVTVMIGGAQDIIPAIIRIITAGVLAGVLIQTGAANAIANTIITRLGKSRVLLALALATMILTMVGVFIDIAVITVASVALTVAKKANLSRMSILLAMIGGGKAGNIISPNPNTIVVAERFNIELYDLMIANIIPAIVGFAVTIAIAHFLKNKGDFVQTKELQEENNEASTCFFKAMLGPLFAIFLLSLRPLTGFEVDPLIALPIGGVVTCLALGKIKYLNSYVTYGLGKMSSVAILLVGTGTVAGVLKVSTTKDVVIALLEKLEVSGVFLAPIAGMVMSAATASTTAGATVASLAFGDAIVAMGVASLSAGAMLHAGATVFDHLPHGSFFHATAGAVNMDMDQRLKLVVYESAIGITMAFASVLIYGVFV